MITDIYRIKTANSIYEIQVADQDGTNNRPSRCRKEGETAWKRVSDFSGKYLEKLFIGPSFDVPGVVLTSMVEDYVHLVPSGEPKRRLTRQTDIPGAFSALTDAIIGQVRGQVAVVGEPIIGIEDDGPMDSYL